MAQMAEGAIIIFSDQSLWKNSLAQTIGSHMCPGVIVVAIRRSLMVILHILSLLLLRISKALRLGVVLMFSIATPPPVLAAETIPGTTIWQAPVGHRQPRANDVTDASSMNGVSTMPILDAEDRELARKLRICRGC
jgi:hypothetical protein